MRYKKNQMWLAGLIHLLPAVSFGVEPPPDSFQIPVAVAITVNPDYRGVRLDAFAPEIVGEFSRQGFSAGFSAGVYSDEIEGDIHVDYSYAYEAFVLSGGLQYQTYEVSPKEAECFVEVSGREDVLGFTPSAFLSVGPSASILELRIRKSWTYEKLSLSSYAEIIGGDLYSDSWGFAYFRTGAVAKLDLESNWSLSAYGALMVREAQLREVDGQSEWLGQVGLRLLYVFH